jgi:hypothetical protein
MGSSLPLRGGARPRAARAVAAIALFCAMAVALLAGGASGLLASAEAKEGARYKVEGLTENDNRKADRTDARGDARRQDYRLSRDDEDDHEDRDDDEEDEEDEDEETASEPGTPSSDDWPSTSEQSGSSKPGKGRGRHGDGGKGKGGGGEGGKGKVGGDDQVESAVEQSATASANPQPAPTASAPAASQPSSTTQPASEAPRERSSDRKPDERRVRTGPRGRSPADKAGPPAGRVADAGGVAEATASGSLDAAPATGAATVGAGGTRRDGDVGATGRDGKSEGGSAVTRTVRDISEVVPDSLRAVLVALVGLSVLLTAGYVLLSLRARGLARQRRDLLKEVGLLQTALLPPVPERLGALRTSVSYRPADGPGAGGDFYDALPLPGGRVGFILGDVSGHGRAALARTAFMRYTLRAYLEAGLEPRVALQVAGRVIDENLGGDFATVLLAVHDPETGSLTYASAGHPAPVVVGPQSHDPVTTGSSPPIGIGERTGLRQTTVPLVPGSIACFFTDGLVEARTEEGILGRERLAELLDGLGPEPRAEELLERVAAEARVLSDDMAALIVSPTAGVTAGLFRTEQLELSARELEGPMARRFLQSCGLPSEEVDVAERDARALAERFGGVVLHVVFGNRLHAEVLPRNLESIEAASRRAAVR